MDKPNLSTYQPIIPMIYSWITPDLPKYDGWEKIGYTTQSVDTRIAQQANQLKITKQKLWARRAFFTSEEGGTFSDHDFHRYLQAQGVQREPGSEWHLLKGAAKTSLEYFGDFQGGGSSTIPGSADANQEYTLRPEQREAVEQALTAFQDGYEAVLWNAKPRFGKTLTTYDLMRRMEAKRVLVVTNRPAIANSWYDDFARFISHQTTYKFVSESSSLAKRNPMSPREFTKYLGAHGDEDVRRIDFVSLQDLKGSERFGGKYDKNAHITELKWDLLVIDEAHEGVDTLKTDVAFDQIERRHTLHLSGTPFKALASGKFAPEQIFNWTYEDEQSAKRDWTDGAADNPYEGLPTLNLYTYQMSRMITDRLEVGVAAGDESAENIDYAFDLNQFFATKDNGFFEHEEQVILFLDRLTQNEKYPFSTPELRDEIRHSFWLLERVASARALKKLLAAHPVFKDYEVILAAGNGRADEEDADTQKSAKALDAVKGAIARAEESGGKTITLSVGQLTTGVTIPEWTAVVMLSNMKSPALYMQAAFRAQNPCIFERAGEVFEKKNAYVFDFAPERTLTIFDAFANNLRSNPSGETGDRTGNIATLLNFFPVIGEDADGKMTLLDAEQVLTFPQAFKAREVVRRGFMSNLLFDNVAGIFRNPDHYKRILDKLPTAKQGKTKTDEPVEIPDPPPTINEDGVAVIDHGIVIAPKVEHLGKPVWSPTDVPKPAEDSTAKQAARQVAQAVTQQAHEVRVKLQEEYGLTKSQTLRDEKATEREVEIKVERAVMERDIQTKTLDRQIKQAATEAEAEELATQKAAAQEDFQKNILEIVTQATDSLTEEIVTREETRKVQKEADKTMEEARSHLRGFARTIPMFLMAYGDRDLTLANFDDYTPDDVFEEITGITEQEFRILRDGQEIVEEDGNVARVPGLFDQSVFDQAIQEFLDKKEALANYFDPELTENIFAYIPQQKTSLIFTPDKVVKQMVDVLETENPGIFTDPDKTFADLVSTAGLFLMELVRRLDAGLQETIPDERARLKHILTSQIFKLSQNELLHRVTIESVSGGVPERKEWMDNSGHYRVGNIAKMTPEEREAVANEMLNEGADNE